MQIVQIGFTGCDKLFADSNGKRNVGEAPSVQVADFALSDVKENDAAKMAFHSHSRP